MLREKTSKDSTQQYFDVARISLHIIKLARVMQQQHNEVKIYGHA